MVTDERRMKVDAARQLWIKQLIDLSRRNNLIYYRALTKGTLDFSECDEEELRSLFSGRRVSIANLVEEDELVKAAAKVAEIRKKALVNLEEKGLETLLVAVGMATWNPTDEGRAPEAPVLLLPVEIEMRGRDGRTVAIRRTGDVQLNSVLVHVLDVEHGVRAATETILGDNATEGDAFDYQAAFARLYDAAKSVRGFRIQKKAVLGNFAFQKMAMVKDLQEQGDALASHDLIAAIAGDLDARSSVVDQRCDVELRELDKRPPEEEFLVLDADSSQQRVAHCVMSSQDGVIHGPPGTGKSQTIANLIVALAAQGKRTLFVAEKRAALEVVLQRLDRVGLGHLALDLHGASIKRSEVMKRIGESLEILRNTPPVNAAEVHRKFEDRRQRLNDHAERVHKLREPAGASVYEIQGRLLRLPPEAETIVRFRGHALDGMTKAAVEELSDLLAEASSLSTLFLGTDQSPWTGASLDEASHAQQALDAARSLPEAVARLETATGPFIAATGYPPPISFQHAHEQVTVADETNTWLEKYEPAVFGLNLAGVLSAMGPGVKGGFGAGWTRLFNSAFKAAKKSMLAVRRGEAEAQLIYEEAGRLMSLQSARRRLTQQTATVVETAQIKRALHEVAQRISVLDPYLPREGLAESTWPDLKELAKRLADDPQTPFRIPRVRAIQASLHSAGLQSLVDDIRASSRPPALWPRALEHAWLSSCLDRAREQDPELGGFSGEHHNRLAADFRELDKQRLAIAIDRVKRLHAETAVAVRSANREQDDIVTREARKKRKHLPLRRVFEDASDVLTALRPCWMASPLSVSQLLSARQAFDVVIFDEASQVLPEDAVPTLLRGQRAVVAGDDKQLPPTTFFFSGSDDEGEAEAPIASEGFESVLELMSAFIEPWPLEWHYRSRSESLIAFSNRHIYRDRLVTFPSPGERPAVSHVLVDQVLSADGEEESSSAEVERVTQLVIEHATEMLTRPEKDRETLGVIAMGIKHARRIEASLDAARASRPDLDEFFAEDQLERFFVKNLERVQGDERDAIILSVGYGKDRSGRLLYRFGPLNVRGGERRLNVAVTRARNRMTAVSSFSHSDMDPNRTSSEGARLLRLYLQYAASQGRLMGDEGQTPVPVNWFEQDVMDALARYGVNLIPQYGASVYRIDLVVQHPERPGRFVLAIECDGATYHSAPTARDRDRLRQQHLEALGWRFHRIWSTDWFMSREQELRRTLEAIDQAIRHADRVDAGDEKEPSEASVHPVDHPSAPAERPVRGPRPRVRRGLPITDYSDQQLRGLLDWIVSDGLLPSDEELLNELVAELGYKRRGHRITERLEAVIARYRRDTSKLGGNVTPFRRGSAQ